MNNNKTTNSEKDVELAKKRTLLAGVRTLLSHVRTSAVMLSLAFAFIKLDKSNPIDAITIILFVLSGIFLILGFIDLFLTRKYIKKL